MQVAEALLRCHARLLAEPGAAAAAKQAGCTLHNLWLTCNRVIHNAKVLAAREAAEPSSSSSNSRSVSGGCLGELKLSRQQPLPTPDERRGAAVGVQQVMLASVSARMTFISSPTERPGAAVISMFVRSVKLLTSVYPFVSPALAGAWHDQPLAACLFLVGRCLLGMAEQLQLCGADPGRHPFRGWLAASRLFKLGAVSTADQPADSSALALEVKELGPALVFLGGR